jgi:hypothetical protein
VLVEAAGDEDAHLEEPGRVEEAAGGGGELSEVAAVEADADVMPAETLTALGPLLDAIVTQEPGVGGGFARAGERVEAVTARRRGWPSHGAAAARRHLEAVDRRGVVRGAAIPGVRGGSLRRH